MRITDILAMVMGLSLVGYCWYNEHYGPDEYQIEASFLLLIAIVWAVVLLVRGLVLKKKDRFFRFFCGGVAGGRGVGLVLWVQVKNYLSTNLVD